MKILKISASHLKEISKLKLKKFRDETKTFLIETEKVLDEAIKSNWKLKTIYLTTKNLSLLTKYEKLPLLNEIKIYELTEIEFKKISTEVTPSGIAGLVEKKISDLKQLFNSPFRQIIVFENISDPGNLGTIIRTSDWFGFKAIVLSKDSVELTNPKVIRASMGSIFHLDIFENVELTSFLLSMKNNSYKIIGTSTTGKNIIKFDLPDKFIFVFGNESKGISKDVLSICDEVISIPSFGKSESLNVAISTSIILYEIKRKFF